MKKTISLLLIFAATCLLFSCQKELDEITTITPPPDNGGNEGGDTANSIIGNWNFVSITAETESTSEVNFPNIQQNTTAFLNYTTTNNAGIVVINDSEMNINGLAYTVSSTIKTYTYKNGVLSDSLETPFNITYPPTESSCIYKLIGTDSIFFPKNGFTNIAASKLKTTPPAAKINFRGDTLTFNQTIYKDTIQTASGIDYHIIQKGNAVITMVKK
jgi:hypothetical protein